MSDDYFSSVAVETTIVDNSIATVSDTLTLSLMPLLVGGFTSKGIHHKVTQVKHPDKVLSLFGSDFETLTKYGQQNLNFMNHLRGGGTGFFVRLVHEDTAKKACRLISLKIKKNDNIQVYERDGYGAYKLDGDGNKVKLTYLKPDDGGGDPVKTDVKVPGLELEILATVPAINDVNNPVPAVSITKNDDVTTTIPLFFIHSNTLGACGDNFSLRLKNDFQRDDMVADGRRYMIDTFELTSAGYSQQEKSFYFSFNPEAMQSEYLDVSESLSSVYTNEDNNGVPRDIQLHYYSEFYPDIIKLIDEAIGEYNVFVSEAEENNQELFNVIKDRSQYLPSSAIETDFINGKTVENLNYDYIVRTGGPDDTNISTSPVAMSGGSDGWLDNIGVEVTNPYFNGADDPAVRPLTKDDTKTTDWKKGVVTQEFRNAVKKLLLVNFYNCDIVSLRSEILSMLKCPSGYIADANYDLDIKKAMIEFASLRKDMGVVFDGTLESTNIDLAINWANTLKNLVSSANDPQRFCIVPFIGTTMNTTKRERVTATYEFCYDIAKVFASKPFAIIAGYQNQFGAIRTMKFDWVVEEDKPRGAQFKKAKDASINYAVDLGVAASTIADDNVTGKKYYWMANRSFYPKKNSKFVEFRNGLTLADIRRTCSTVLVRYAFDDESTAEANMIKAKEDLDKQIAARYPKSMTITTTFFRTEHDRLTNNCSVLCRVTFPDIIEQYTVTISGERLQ